MPRPDLMERMRLVGLRVAVALGNFLIIGGSIASEPPATSDRANDRVTRQNATGVPAARKGGDSNGSTNMNAAPGSATVPPAARPKKDPRAVVVQMKPKGAGDFSPEFRESLRRTNELRRQRRAVRGPLATDTTSAPGAVVPWPMPPSLIVKQTPQVHDEINSFLRLLRR